MAKVPYYFPNLSSKFREEYVEFYPATIICALLRMFGTQTSGYGTLKTALINQLIDVDSRDLATNEFVPNALFEDDRAVGWVPFLAFVADGERPADVEFVKVICGDYSSPLNLFDTYFDYDNVQVDTEPSNPMSLETAKTYVDSIINNPRRTDIPTILPQLTASDQIDFLDCLFLRVRSLPAPVEEKAAKYYAIVRAFCENGYKQNIVPFLIMLVMSPCVDGTILVSLIDMMFSFTEHYTPDNFIMFSMPSGMTVEEFTARATKTNSYCVTGITPEAYTESGGGSTLSVNYNSTKIINSLEITPPINVIYNGSIIATLNEGDTKTLQCNGKVMQSDVVIGGKTLQCNGKVMASDVVVEVVGATPTIDLDGYTWYGNDTIDVSQEFSYNLALTVQGYTEKNHFSSDGSSLIIFDDTIARPVQLYYDGWTNENYRTIVFGSGQDSTNQELVAWLQANGTLTPPRNE